jgi:hypothetical protein
MSSQQADVPEMRCEGAAECIEPQLVWESTNRRRPYNIEASQKRVRI